MDTSDETAIGHALAARHADAVQADRDASLINYAERPRIGDWSMRAALTRYAQPQAVRASQVLTLVRRVDASLHQLSKQLERHTVISDRALVREAVVDPPIEPYPDTRVADLARLEAGDPAAFGAVLVAYEAEAGDPLDDTERAALPLLGVALQLDALAETLTTWANRGPQDPPLDEVDTTCDLVRERLDELGVPAEQGPPAARRGRRDRGV